MGLKKQRGGQNTPFFSYITFQVHQFPLLHGQADFTRMDAVNCAGQGKTSQTKQHHWMWAWSLGEATAISVPGAAGLSPLSLAMFLPTSSQTSCLLGCSAAQYNKPIRRLRWHWVGWAALTAGCHQKGQVCHSSSHLADSANTGQKKKLIFIIFYWRAGYRNSRIGNWDWEQRRGTCTLLGQFQLIQLQRCTESGTAFPISSSSAVSSPFLWAGFSLQWAGSAGHLAKQSRWDTVTVWTWQPRVGLASFGRLTKRLITKPNVELHPLILGWNVPFSGYIRLNSLSNPTELFQLPLPCICSVSWTVTWTEEFT